jgi:hypothetical protein
MPTQGSAGSLASYKHFETGGGGNSPAQGFPERFASLDAVVREGFALDDSVSQRDRRPVGPAAFTQISEAQNLHFEASGAFASLQNGQAFVGAGGAAGNSLMNIVPTQKTTSATTMKTMTALMRLP